jgi:hypothetical protein
MSQSVELKKHPHGERTCDMPDPSILMKRFRHRRLFPPDAHSREERRGEGFNAGALEPPIGLEKSDSPFPKVNTVAA